MGTVILQLNYTFLYPIYNLLGASSEREAMSLAFFIYTLTLLVICVVTGAVCISAYLVSHRRMFLLAAGMFFFYLFDVSFIFQNEFLAQNLSFDTDLYYKINCPLLKIVVAGGFLQCLWLIVCDYLNERRKELLICPIAVFALACLFVLWLVPVGAWQQFLYYSTRQVFLFWVAGYALCQWFHASDEVDRMRLNRFRKGFVFFVVVAMFILAEDALVILMLEPGFIPPEFPLYLSERNFSENLLLLLLAWFALRAASDALRLRFEQPPQREDKPIQRHIDDLLPAYCKQHGLSSREGEVLRLVLMGKDNQNIASDLTLALGTVKTHVHNILKKTGQSNRDELKRSFWSE